MEKIKESFNEKRSVLGKVLPLDTPYTLMIDISDVCNLKCNYCFRNERNNIMVGNYNTNKMMDWAIFEKVIEQVKEFPQDIKRISLSNHGESLCNRLIPKMVKYIKDNGITACTEIHTNGLLLDEKYIDELVEAQIDRIIISLQGLSSEKYEEICGAKINFDNFYRNLKYLYERKTNTIVNIKIVDAALDSGEEDLFYEMFSDRADRIFIEKVIPLWDGITYEESNKQEGISNKYGRKFKYQECCPLVFYTLVVASDGRIMPCTALREPFRLGNVNNMTLKEAWNSDERKRFLMKHLEEGRINNSYCKDCYIPQNTIMIETDSIDKYKEEILNRMNEMGVKDNGQ